MSRGPGPPPRPFPDPPPGVGRFDHRPTVEAGLAYWREARRLAPLAGDRDAGRVAAAPADSFEAARDAPRAGHRRDAGPAV